MSGIRLQLPTIQNWSCHSCSGCCRQHDIEITEEEKDRIEKQNWTPADGVPASTPAIVTSRRLFGKKRHTLGHSPDGACVFLDDKGLCRIHAKFGEPAKPLACRLYPYAFHPAGKTVVVSLRYSCPSVVANKGRSLDAQKDELRRLAHDVVPSSYRQLPAPHVSPHQRLDWPDFLSLVDAVDGVLATPRAPLLVRLLRALSLVDLIGQSKFEKIGGSRLKEFLDLVVQASQAEVAAEDITPREPTAAGKMQFRMLVAQYARKDTHADLARGWRNRWRLLRSAMAFAKGNGTIPILQENFGETAFSDLEGEFGGVTREMDEILTRYFRVKVQGLHFCGAAYYDVPFTEGFQSLALMFPVVMWLARWLAVGDRRTTITTDDVSRALAVADHHHGYSPIFGSPSFRRRVRLLASMKDIERLCAWYGR
ncbi:MAG: YkgJ family cysteine cluster protein [Planctomycetaceae bacterium]